MDAEDWRREHAGEDLPPWVCPGCGVMASQFHLVGCTEVDDSEVDDSEWAIDKV